jgi:hypothetical protein
VLIVRQDHEPFRTCLGDPHAIKRVAMMERELGDRMCVVDGDIQEQERLFP